jgi:hypothetical protein
MRLFGSFAASGNCFICPADLAQNDLRRLALSEEGLSSVTAVLSFDPGLAARYALTPFSVMPAPCLVGRKLPDFTEVAMPIPFFAMLRSLRNNHRIQTVAPKIALVFLNTHVTQLNGWVNPDFITQLSGSVTEQKVLADVSCWSDFEVKDCVKMATRVVVVVAPLWMLFN